MVTEVFDVATDDGRTLCCLIAGAADGPVIVVQHGTPGGKLLYEPWVDDAVRRGGRLVSFNRAGYGGSTRQPGRTVADVVLDVAAIADAVGADRFSTVGASGGGPHALACAALLPDHCVAAASIAGVAPHDADGLDFLAGMGEDNIVEFGAAVRGEEQLRPLLHEWRQGLLTADAAHLVDELRSLLSPPDVAVTTDEIGAALAAGLRDGLAPGVDGWVDDDLAFTRPWGFDLGAIRIPVQLWQGRQDLMVPPAHGEWLAARIPKVDAHLEPDEGHVTLAFNGMARVLGWLINQQ